MPTMAVMTLLIVLLSLTMLHALTPTLIAGRRCLLLTTETKSKCPMVLLGGTAQTIESWEPRLRFFSNENSVLVYEGIGQGPTNLVDEKDLTLPQQAHSLAETLDEAFAENQKVHLVGFSLGARIAMAFCVLYPKRVEKMHLTGIASEPSDAGLVALEAWKDLLSANGNMQGFAWNILQTTYSASFLRKNQHRLAIWVSFISKNNSAKQLSAILEQTRSMEAWTPMAMAEKISRSGRIVVGENDIMAPPKEAQLLSDTLKWGPIHILPDAGHAVPTEAARLWQRDVLEFLHDE